MQNDLTAPLDANAMLDEAAKQPTLDEYLRRDPATLSAADFSQVILFERGERARVLAAKSAKADKKAGVAVMQAPEPADTGAEPGSSL